MFYLGRLQKRAQSCCHMLYVSRKIILISQERKPDSFPSLSSLDLIETQGMCLMYLRHKLKWRHGWGSSRDLAWLQGIVTNVLTSLVSAVVLSFNCDEEVFEQRLQEGEGWTFFRFPSPTARHDVINLGSTRHISTSAAVGRSWHAVASINLLQDLSVRQIWRREKTITCKAMRGDKRI